MTAEGSYLHLLLRLWGKRGRGKGTGKFEAPKSQFRFSLGICSPHFSPAAGWRASSRGPGFCGNARSLSHLLQRLHLFKAVETLPEAKSRRSVTRGSTRPPPKARLFPAHCTPTIHVALHLHPADIVTIPHPTALHKLKPILTDSLSTRSTFTP
jgi:hypothetical protein